MAQIQYRTYVLKTDSAAVRQRIGMKADFLQVIRHPTDAGLKFRVGRVDSDPIPAEQVASVRNCTPWEETFLDWSATPGGEIEIVLGLGCEAVQFVSGVRSAQGASGSDPWAVKDTGSTLDAGEDAAVGAASALAPTSSCRAVMIRADVGNTDDILIGDSAGQFYPLEPGESVSIPINDPAKIYRKSVSGVQRISWIIVA